ncbi:hypothetical protein ABFS83_08G087700 [Erythranthe nasuta]
MKEATTNQYYTTIQIGFKGTTLNIVIDLGGKFLYFYSDNYSNATSSYRSILCDTQPCKVANVVGCTKDKCSDCALNPFTGTQGYEGLEQDVLHVQSTLGDRYTLNNLSFQISDPALPKGLAVSTLGLIGLGRTRISLQAQIASAFEIVCVPPTSSTDGILIVGEPAYINPVEETSNSSSFTTPLIRNHASTYGNGVIGNLTVEYFIDVKSVKVGSKTLSLNKTLLSISKEDGSGGTSIKTVRPYKSTLHRTIYGSLIDEFVKATASQNIKRVAYIGGSLLASIRRLLRGRRRTGPQVPTIDLVMKNKNAYWRFYGANSMFIVLHKIGVQGKFGGILLSAASKDANDGVFSIALAIVHEENDDN